MRSIICLTLLTSVLSACNTSAPKPPVVEECVLISVQGIEPYLYCRYSDGSEQRWNVTIPDANKYICTTPESYAAGKKYAQDLNDWVNTNCK